MNFPAVTSKVSDFLQTSLLSSLPECIKQLVEGNFYEIEQFVSKACRDIFNEVMNAIVPFAAQEIMSRTSVEGRTNCRVRPCVVRLLTGHRVTVNNFYDRSDERAPQGERHQLLRYWKTIDGFSPGLCDRAGYLAMLSASYDLAGQAFEKITMASISTSSVDKITTRLADKCHNEGEENLALEPEESLAGKRIQIGSDGGRSRIRNYTGQENQAGNPTFTTPWIEPKLFVIHVLKDDGELDRSFSPIYGCRFGDDESIELMGKYLAKLNVSKAKEVQIVGDGAPWIWNRIKPMLLRLGMSEDRITETIDYGHAVSYLHQLVEAMPKRVGKKQRRQHLDEMKAALKAGDTDYIYLKCQTIFKRPSQLVRRWVNYFVKHHDRMQYADFEAANLSKGSGIVESAIRRVINLRFKNVSTFWLPERLEKLYFLRCVMLSGRWDTVMKNLTKST